MSFNVVTSTLASAVADDGTFTVSYPTGKDEGDYYLAMQHKLSVAGDVLNYPVDFDITLGTSNITVTNKSGSAWAAGSTFYLQLEQQGDVHRMEMRDRNSSQQFLEDMATVIDGSVVLINLGAPDVADADGVSASQAVTVATTPLALINGALASSGVATFDRARNVVAAWTGTSVLTVTGTDKYGDTLVESSASGTSLTGKKAFKTVTSASFSADVTGATIGSGSVLGLPVFLPSESNILAVLRDGVTQAKGVGQRLLLTGQIVDVSTASELYLASPVAGTLKSVYTALNNAITVADATLTVKTQEGTAGTITVATSGSAAGDVDSLTPTSNQTVTAGSTIEVETDGGSTTASVLDVTAEIEVTSEASGAIVAGIRVADGSTATTGDVRGTYAPNIAPDGAAVLQLIAALPDASYLGVPQYAG